MSTTVMEQSRAPVDLPVAEGNAGLNFLGIVRRRWPWVLVGLFVGTIGGLLAYTARKPVYQSTAKVLVVKNKETIPGGGLDGRMAYMEDYMSTQSTILKSETVLNRAAATIIKEFPAYKDANIESVSKQLSAAFTVAREKDPNSPTSSNNVLNLAIKGGNAEDCRKFLDIIIVAYADELKGVYDIATTRKLDLLKIAIAETRRQQEQFERESLAVNTRIRELTQEEPLTISSRYSENTKLLNVLDNEEIEVRRNLDLIATAGEDKTKRHILMMRLAQYARGQQVQGLGAYNPNDPLSQLRELNAIIAEKSRTLGPNHPQMMALEGRKKYLEDLARQLNPADPTGKLDGLDQLKEIFISRRETLVELIDKVRANQAKDSTLLKNVMPLKSQMDQFDKKIENRSGKVDSYTTEESSTNMTRATGGYEAKAIDKPNLNNEQIAPRLIENLLLGMAVGILFGIGLAGLAEISDKGFRSPADIRARLGLPVIGHIPPIRTNAPADEPLDLEPTLVTALRPKSVEAEAYRGVRTALYFNAAGSTHQMIQVTSPSQGDGKSTLAANLAVSIAQSGKRTLLVDCDMRRPRVHRVFHLADPGPGLAAVINGGVPLSAAIQRSVIENLSILPCGKKPANPAELLTSPNFSDLLDRLKSDYDYVILDTPPVLAVSDPSAVAPRADGVILVFRMTSKVRPLAERAREQLTQIGANIIGVVVNGSGRGSDAGYGYGGEYTGYTSSGQYMDNYDDSDEEETSPPRKG